MQNKFVKYLMLLDKTITDIPCSKQKSLQAQRSSWLDDAVSICELKVKGNTILSKAKQCLKDAMKAYLEEELGMDITFLPFLIALTFEFLWREPLSMTK